MRKYLMLLAATALLVVLAACGSSSNEETETTDIEETGTEENASESEETKEIRFAHPYDDKHPLHLASMKFAEQIEEETGGAITFDFFPNGELGGANDLMEGLGMKTVDISLIATPIIGSRYKPMDLFYLPFLFKDNEHAYRVADGEVGEALYEGAREELGVKTLAMFESGFRTITNSKHEVRTPEDLKGLKIRFADAPVSIDTFQTLGVNGTPLALGELYTALQQGVVDGQDNPLGNVYTLKFYEVQPYITLSEHQWAGITLLMDDDLFNSLTEEQQEIFVHAAKAAEEWQREKMQEEEANYIADMKEEGVEIIELSQDEKDKFIEVLEEVWEDYKGEIGEELIDKAVELGNN